MCFVEIFFRGCGIHFDPDELAKFSRVTPAPLLLVCHKENKTVDHANQVVTHILRDTRFLDLEKRRMMGVK